MGVLPLLRASDKGIPFHHISLLCVEALSALVVKANTEGVLMGVPTLKYGPRISHLFLADDNLLFCRSSITQ